MSFFPRCSPWEISTPNFTARRSYRSCCAPYAPVPTIRTGLSPIYGEKVLGLLVQILLTISQNFLASLCQHILVLLCGDANF